jgi:hypothetical protein
MRTNEQSPDADVCSFVRTDPAPDEAPKRGFVGERVKQENPTDLVPELDAGNPPDQFDESRRSGMETERGEAREAPATERFGHR